MCLPNAGDARNRGSIPGLARSPGVGNGNPPQYPGMENSMDRGAWWTILHGITKSCTWLSDWACTIIICVYVYTYKCIYHSGWHLKVGKLASGATPCHLLSPISFSIASAQNTMKVKVEVTQSYVTLCDPMDYRVHGILQARILEWVAFPFSRGIFPNQNQT